MHLLRTEPKEPTRNERKLLRRKCPKNVPPKRHQVAQGWLDNRGCITHDGREDSWA